MYFDGTLPMTVFVDVALAWFIDRRLNPKAAGNYFHEGYKENHSKGKVR